MFWTAAEKSNPAGYKKGMLVEINRPVPGFITAEKVEVVDVRSDMVRVRSVNPYKTKTAPLPLEMPEAFTVYESVVEKGCKWKTLENLGWSKAQKSDPEHYKIGLVVQIHSRVPGFALDEQLEVVRASDDSVKLRSLTSDEKRAKLLPIGRPSAFSVYQEKEIEICERESIRLTGNGRSVQDRRLYSGSTYKVDYVDHEGRLTLDNGQKLGREFKHIEFDYADTSHSSQGRTLDRVFIAQSPELSYGASSRRQLVVCLSRARKEAKIWTTDIEVYRDMVAYDPDRMMATELLRDAEMGIAEKQSKSTTRSSVALGKKSEVPALTTAAELAKNGLDVELSRDEVEIEPEMDELELEL